MDDVALSHQHVVHLMFAPTALQLSRCRPKRAETALLRVIPEMANITSDNCDAVLSSAQLICFVNWAKGPQPGEYLAFGDHGRSDWLVMFCGVWTTLNSLARQNFTKTYAPDLRTKGRSLPPMMKPDGYEEQLSDLRDHVLAVIEPSGGDVNVCAVDDLTECYASRYDGVNGELHVSFVWLYRMPDLFLDRLQGRDPTALIIYAHFVVLMHEMERFWYLKGWTHHVMSGIFHTLDREHIAWIRWPRARVEWVAP
ncbi:hypothetical protein EK21DRAFT_104143 [Setomelanomma holmii]|uniref:Uncharacterized protein n=1 Tax=Setomelanomma holmii TaxID=210430 RepID=A0A9P4GYF5_9PLEO|nr:hypothetical protein EK21DRAFT_104143 [Setomelanomma holmii]